MERWLRKTSDNKTKIVPAAMALGKLCIKGCGNSSIRFCLLHTPLSIPDLLDNTRGMHLASGVDTPAVLHSLDAPLLVPRDTAALRSLSNGLAIA